VPASLTRVRLCRPDFLVCYSHQRVTSRVAMSVTPRRSSRSISRADTACWRPYAGAPLGARKAAGRYGTFFCSSVPIRTPPGCPDRAFPGDRRLGEHLHIGKADDVPPARDEPARGLGDVRSGFDQARRCRRRRGGGGGGDAAYCPCGRCKWSKRAGDRVIARGHPVSVSVRSRCLVISAILRF